jgi:hypothetical protein
VSSPAPNSDRPPPVRHSPLISSQKLARILDNPRSPNPRDRWDARRVTRMLRAARIGQQLTPRGLWYTTYAELRERVPPIADLYASKLHEDDVEDL